MDETAEGNMKQWSEGSTVTALSFARAFGERCPNCKSEVASGGEDANQADDGGVLQCPGCRAGLQLAVAMEQPPMGLWVASVVGLTLGAGFCVGMLLLVAPTVAMRPAILLTGIVSIMLLVLLISIPNWFCERGKWTRWMLAVVSFTLSLTAPWLFIWILF